MLDRAIEWAQVEPTHVLFVGDQETDRQAAQAAGVDFEWASEIFGEES